MQSGTAARQHNRPAGRTLGESVLMSLKHGDLATARKLVYRGADANSTDDFATTPLMLVSRMTAPGSVGRQVICLLLSRGAHIDAADNAGRTALLLSLEYGDLGISRLLLHCGAQVKPLDKRMRGIVVAGLLSRLAQSAAVPDPALSKKSDAYGLLARLVRLRAYVPARDARNSESLVHMAATLKDPRYLRLLLQRGLDPNVTSTRGITPLMVAVQCGLDANVRLLLTHGADANAKTTDDWSLWNFMSSDHPLSVETRIMLDDRLPVMSSGPTLRSRYAMSAANLRAAGDVHTVGSAPAKLEGYGTGDRKISLYWDAVPGAIGYKVYRGQQSDLEDYRHPINIGQVAPHPSYPGTPRSSSLTGVSRTAFRTTTPYVPSIATALASPRRRRTGRAALPTFHGIHATRRPSSVPSRRRWTMTQV